MIAPIAIVDAGTIRSPYAVMVALMIVPLAASAESRRYLPVRTRTPGRPTACAPRTSFTMSSPIMATRGDGMPRASSPASRKEGRVFRTPPA